MLSLDDPEWSRLSHAYGLAADIPELLRQADLPAHSAIRGEEPWEALWSSLCHQGDVYSASYAAVPHLIATAGKTAGPVAFDFFLLPASIEVARINGRGPEMPPSLSDDYFSALTAIMDCVSRHSGEPWSQDMMISVAAAQAVSKRRYALAEAIMTLDDDLIARINRGEWD